MKLLPRPLAGIWHRPDTVQRQGVAILALVDSAERWLVSDANGQMHWADWGDLQICDPSTTAAAGAASAFIGVDDEAAA